MAFCGQVCVFFEAGVAQPSGFGPLLLNAAAGVRGLVLTV
jgi:hypothetical protein